MAAVLTGTPIAIAWGASANPAAQSITIPADATAVYMAWAWDGVDVNGEGLASATLASSAPAQTGSLATATGFQPATGICAWYNPPTGAQDLDVAWTTAPVEGPVCIVFFTKDGNTTTWRDADAAHAAGTTAVGVVLTTEAGDLVVKFDQRYDAGGNAPVLTSGWTNGQTQTAQQSENARLSYISATGTTTACDSENEDYSSIVAIAIGPFTGGGDTTAPTLSSPTSAAASSSTATGTVSTDEGNGTAYAVVTTSATAPSVAQVQAGQNHAGAAAAWAGSQAVSSTGTKTFNATGLAPSTTYWFHYQHRDAASNDSTVVSSASFTTPAASPNITGSSSATPQRGAAHTVTGSGFGATQGTKQLRVGGVVQTPTAWADGSITYTLAADLIKSGVAVNVEIWETSPSDSLLSNSFALTSIQPQAGWSFVDVGTPNTTAANRLTFSADAASGDQAEWFTDGGKFTVNTDLTFTATGYGTFGARLWTPGDGFGAAADQVVTPFNVLGSGRVTRPALSTSPLGVGPLLSGATVESVAAPATATAARVGMRADVAAAKGVAMATAARAGARAAATGTKAVTATVAGRAGARGDAQAAKAVAATTAGRAGARASVAAVASIGRSTSTDARAGARADAAATKAATAATAGRAGGRADLAATKAAAHATGGRAGVRASVTAVAAIGITTSTQARAGVRADVAGTKAAQGATASRAGGRAELAAAKAVALAASARVGARASVSGVPVSGIATSAASRAGARASVVAVRGASTATSSVAGLRGDVSALKAAQAVTAARAGVMGATTVRKGASTTTAARVGVRAGSGGSQLLPFVDGRFYKLPAVDGYYSLPLRAAYLDIQ